MTKTIQFITAILLFVFLTTSCEKAIIDDPDPDPIITDIHITKDITENTLWLANNIYYVDLSINVTNNAILTIEPGTIIKYADGKQMDVSYSSGSNGNIIALGTKDLPIIFTSQAQIKAKGDWNGLWLWEGANTSKFEYCIFEYAGGSINSDGSGGINLKQAKNVAIDRCEFTNSDSYGVFIYQSIDGLSSFTDNYFADNTTNDIKLKAYNVSSIGEGNFFSKNIEVEGSKIDAPGDVLWRNHNTDYIIINRDIELGSNTGTNLIIEAGCNLKFSNFGVQVAKYSDSFGMITAIGNDSIPITITSAVTNPSKGDWRSIYFYDGSSNGSIFEYCTFSYGGGGIGVNGLIGFGFEQGSTTTFSNCIFSNSETYGIALNQPNNDTSYPTLIDNTFSDNTEGDLNWQ